MTFKTILVPVEGHDRLDSVFSMAELFARPFGAYLEGTPVRSLVADIYIAGAFGGVPVPQLPAEGTSSAELRKLADAEVQRLGIGRGSREQSGLRYAWHEQEPLDDITLAAQARVFDITVFGRIDKDGNGPRLGPLETTLFESGRPILIAPPSTPKTCGETVLVAWNCSTETARTVALAMPILERAKEVIVLTVEGGTVPGPAGSEMTAALAANGVPAKERTVRSGGKSTGEVILAEATLHGADLLIKGAYTQSRLRQMIFGGATSHILSAAELPVFMAH